MDQHGTKSTVKSASDGKKISRGLVRFHLRNRGKVKPLSVLRAEAKESLESEKEAEK